MGEGGGPLSPAVHPCAKVEALMTPSVPFRDTFWNVPGWAQVALYVGSALAIVIFAYGMWQRVSLWRRGVPEDRLDRISERIGLVVAHGLGQGMAVWRRFVSRPASVDATARFAWALTLLFVINVTGFVMEACRLAVVQPWWGPWSPVGYALGRGFVGLGLTPGALRGLHVATWVFHAATALLFIAIIPYSYFVHLLTTPLNIFFSKLGPRGAIRTIENIEEAETLGISKLEEFSWKRRLDFDACVECGRCQAACPADLSGTALSPKPIIVKLQRHMHGELPGPIHGELIKADELWACTTCIACGQECPAFIDIVDTIIDLPRYLTLSEGALPSTAPQTLQNIQRAGNPWGLPAGERLAWAQGLDVPVLEEGMDVEYLYWVGCSASYDRRNQAIARAVVKILKAAGVSFAVLAEERCHAEVGRRLGEEYLYQTVAQENIENLNRYGVRKVITHCPHCFNTIKNEFPQFGGTYEVIHHSVLIQELIAAGRIKPTKTLDATVVFHDSCYLGRYNGIMDAPRDVARAVPWLRVIDPPRTRERGLCCGGVGGSMRREVEDEKLANVILGDEVVAAPANATGTPSPSG